MRLYGKVNPQGSANDTSLDIRTAELAGHGYDSYVALKRTQKRHRPRHGPERTWADTDLDTDLDTDSLRLDKNHQTGIRVF